MNLEKWTNVVGQIKDNFEVLDQGQEHLDEEGGIDIEFIIFNGPLGKMRLEFVSKPVILDKKTNYSRRIGSETAVNYIYSEDEKSCQLIAYKWDESQNDWMEIENNMFE